MSFVRCGVEVSKSEIIQVAPIHRENYEMTYQQGGGAWVFLENHKKHWDDTDCVRSADEERLFPNKGRTKYKMYRENNTVLVSDNSYCEFVFGGRVVAYVWDKPAVKKGMEKALDHFQKSVAKNPYPDTDPYKTIVQRTFHYLRDFIVYCRDHAVFFAFPPGAVVVLMENYPTRVEKYTIRAYAPIKGYWASHPTVIDGLSGRGYDLEFLLNNKKTEQCHQFLEWENLNYGGSFGHSGHIHYRLEETDRPLKIHQLPTEYPPTSRYQLSDCDWVVTKKEYSPPTERTTIRRTDRTQPLTAFTRRAFSEELSEKVFHPDRVARFMGDTWGTDDSWLAKVM